MSILRPYQIQAKAAFWDTLASEDVNRVAIEMATGLGKTVTGAGIADEWLAGVHAMDRAGSGFFRGHAAGRVLVLVHTDELVRQTVATMASVASRWTIGVVKATRNDVHADIVVASVATLAQPGRRDQITNVGLIIVDECHHATAPTYQAILEHYGALCGCLPYEAGGDGPERECPEHGDGSVRATPVLGLTATLARSDGASLGQTWQALPFTRSTSWAIRNGYLIDLQSWTITVPDVTLAEDRATLDNQMATSLAPELVVQAWAGSARGWCNECAESAQVVSDDVGHPVLPAYCPNDGCGTNTMGPSTVLFAPLVASAHRFADAFNVAGIKAEVISDSVPLSERRAILDRYNAGVTTVVCNAMVLTEGWDSPRTMCVIVARPTKSVPLFVQMVGRGLRPWLGAEAPPREQQVCVLLTIADTTTQLATYADLSDKPLAAGQDGKTLGQMEDEWDLGRELDAEELAEYRGPVKVERWDAVVQASSKAWKFTAAGVPFLPTKKRSEGYVFVLETGQEWVIWYRWVMGSSRKALVRKLATAPDLELAMALAEDEAQEHGGDIGAMLADKSRAWRKAVPSQDMQAQARRLGLGAELEKILATKAAGKAGKLSDLMDKVQATKVIDPVVIKIRARSEA
jgi:superfamily II DNA or RNA helicase